MNDRAIYANANALDLPIGDKSVHMIATSPPYWGLRSYDTGGQKHAELGAEPLHDCLAWARGDEPCGGCYVCNMRTWAREMWRVLRDDGVMFLNLGDSYYNYRPGGTSQTKQTLAKHNGAVVESSYKRGTVIPGLKEKDLVGIPWRVALALQADGWYLRSDIIWAKPNPMPESVTDRATKSHEYIFMLAKSPRYYFDAEAVREEASPATLERNAYGWSGAFKGQFAGTPNEKRWQEGRPLEHAEFGVNGRNIRTVWTIATQPFSGTRLGADYVGDDGKPYKASKDCPIHSPLYYKRNPRKARRDEQLDPIQRRNVGNGDDPDLEPFFSSPANSPRDNQGHRRANRDSLRPESSQRQKHESIGDGKTPYQNLTGRASNADGETTYRTNRTQGRDGYRDDNRGWRGQRYSVVAILHSSPSNRTGRAPLTNQLDNFCAQMICGTGHTQELREYFGPDGHTQANNTEAFSPYELPALNPSGQKNGHTAYKQIGLSLNLPDMSECTCSIAQVDHYATWPPALVERMVKAGTSERGVCPECGKPWERVVERELTGVNEFRPDNGMPGRTGNGLTRRRAGDPVSTTTGWRPTCDHDAAPVPAIVLDPFCGSGTTLMVARQLGRIGLGFDLSLKYLEENAAVRLGHDKLAAWGNGIKDTADYGDLFANGVNQ